MTQKFTNNISYMIHPLPCHIIAITAINTTNYTERQRNIYFCLTWL